MGDLQTALDAAYGLRDVPARFPFRHPAGRTLSQVEIYFSIVLRKVLTAAAAHDLIELAARLLGFEADYRLTSRPFRWKFTRQARIALTMEGEGRLREVIRDPRVGCGDLIERDGAGQEWDVYSPLGVDFDLEQVEGELSEKLMNQQQGDRMMKVIVNCAHLSREQVGEVEKIVEVEGWRDLVRYGTSQSRR